MRTHPLRLTAFLWLLFFLEAPRHLLAEPTAAATAAFNTYTHAVEQRLSRQHRSPQPFLAFPGDESAARARLRRGQLLIDRVAEPATPAPALDGALLHHWRGSAFVPGATAAALDHLLKDYRTYPQHFAPQVLSASSRPQDAAGDHVLAALRVRQKHVLTVVLDAGYDVTFAQPDPQHGYSLSRSTRVAEIASAGTRSEHALPPSEEHGFLWRLNTYWSWEERDGGLYIQLEAVSLTRSVPRGLGWAIGPYLDTIPRDSLAFTLSSAASALKL